MLPLISITTQNLGKKYRKNWLFKRVNLELQAGSSWAILGRNGSGKSTLLKILSGAVTPTDGKVEWLTQGHKIELKDLHSYFSITAPYLELVEEFTLMEMVHFHFQFKPVYNNLDVNVLLEKAQLSGSKDVKIKYFSSGMLQRLKLITSLYSDVPVIFLDEPCTNLDDEGIRWYQATVNEIKQNKLIIVASNQSHEYDFCENKIQIEKLYQPL